MTERSDLPPPLPLASLPSASSSSRIPFLLPSFLESLPAESIHTLSELESQQEEALRDLDGPDTSSCSYNAGYVRQSFYACKTCPGGRSGFCYACSVECHEGHDLVELFPKRGMRCDCPTIAFAQPCSLALTEEAGEEGKKPLNTGNKYDHNYDGRFCDCDADYDPVLESETMIQCLVCEDWFHESHLSLRPPPVPSAAIIAPSREQPSAASTFDNPSTTTKPIAPLLGEDDYAHLICDRCLLSNPIIASYAGLDKFLVVLLASSSSDGTTADAPRSTIHPCSHLQADESSIAVSKSVSSGALAESMVTHDPENDVPQAKRLKRTCTRPKPPAIVQDWIARRQVQRSEGNLGLSAGRADVYLVSGFRDQLCRCDECLPVLSELPFLLEEETTWEAPDVEDECEAQSFDQVLSAALSSLPRDSTIDIISSFNDLSSAFSAHVKAIAEQGRAIEKRDVEEFFEAWKERKRKGRP